VSIGFVAGRHAEIVSADERGLAFYHRLGKVLFVEAYDILRIFGQYPKDDVDNISRRTNGLLPAATSTCRRSILAMMPLPLGMTPHSTDGYSIVALLTPAKLVVVGLKPMPKTWFKCVREEDKGHDSNSESRWKGTLAWFPSVSSRARSKREMIEKGGNDKNNPMSAAPMLAYSWGHSLHLLRIFEKTATQSNRSPRNRKITEHEVGTIVFEEAGKWTTDRDILAVQWLNLNVGSSTSISGWRTRGH
jgi:hypothetical protein